MLLELQAACRSALKSVINSAVISVQFIYNKGLRAFRVVVLQSVQGFLTGRGVTKSRFQVQYL